MTKQFELSDGGANHQKPAGDDDVMTTAQGAPIADDQNWLTAGARGPQLLEDHIAREKIFHFDHERIPERVVHARGYGVHGEFELTDPIPELTRAKVLAGEKGKKTPGFVRFSTVAGSKGSPDLARDVRGFAVKFYTEEGNWDIVGNNIPVFFIQDAIKFPDLIHAVKPAPDRGFPQAQTAHDNFWDFISLTPEAMHMVMWACPIAPSRARFASWKALASTPSGSSTRTATASSSSSTGSPSRACSRSSGTRR